MRIVFLGDSLTWGGYGGNFVDEVQKQMPEYEIINAGEGGETVINLLRRVEDVLTEHKPDAMFVMVGGNDATSYSQPKTRGYYRKAKNSKMVSFPLMNLKQHIVNCCIRFNWHLCSRLSDLRQPNTAAN
jgi:lysophospholipase L1-like esterase